MRGLNLCWLLFGLAASACGFGCADNGPGVMPPEQYLSALGKTPTDRMFAKLQGVEPQAPQAKNLTDLDAYLFELICYVADSSDTGSAQDIFKRWDFTFQQFNNRLFASHAYVLTRRNWIIVVYSGTDFFSSRDWLSNADTDLAFTPVKNGNNIGLHGGFATAVVRNSFMSIRNAVDAARHKPETQVWLIGHSRGGAMACIAAALLMREGYRVTGVCTFGQPKVGNDAFGKWLNDQPFAYVRYVNGDDPVPKLPPGKTYKHAVDPKRLAGSSYQHLADGKGFGYVNDHYQLSYQASIAINVPPDWLRPTVPAEKPKQTARRPRTRVLDGLPAAAR
jgi:lipase (class 3)